MSQANLLCGHALRPRGPWVRPPGGMLGAAFDSNLAGAPLLLGYPACSWAPSWGEALIAP